MRTASEGNLIIMQMPADMGPVHILGIGGIGMSAIAEILHSRGYTVQGSDQKDSANVRRLRAKGMRVFVGHDAVNLVGARNVVISTAVRTGNPELEAARAKGLPIIRRAEMLADLMRLYATVSVTGTHGKTTTTSLIAHIYNSAGLDPTVITGGIINEWGSNARRGEGPWMIVEADESDGTFIKIPTQIGVVTNIDAEHLDHFKTFVAVQDAFRAFIENVPFYGFAVMCTDHPIVQRMVGRIEDRRIITYGENPQADVRLTNLSNAGGRQTFTVLFRDRNGETVHTIKDLTLPMPGRHNALNATSAVAVAHELKVPDDAIRQALAGFGGVKRRFTRAGEWNGVAIIDDYGHHPVEIAAVLKAARESTKGQVIAVVQPHRYTRLQSLFEPFSTCFNDADAVIVAEVYAAGEAPIEGVDRDHLVTAVRARGHRQVIPLPGQPQLAGIVKGLATPGDYVVLLGAGNITQWAYALEGELKALSK